MDSLRDFASRLICCSSSFDKVRNLIRFGILFSCPQENYFNLFHEKTTKLNIPDVFKIRQAIWEDDALLDAFITQNPAQLSAENLDLAASWKLRRAGEFFVYKHLKKHSIFIET